MINAIFLTAGANEVSQDKIGDKSAVNNEFVTGQQVVLINGTLKLQIEGAR